MLTFAPLECQTSSNLFTYFGCETEARQVFLYGIVPCTRMKNSLEQISYPSPGVKFDNDVIIKLGRVARLGNGPSLRGHNRRNGGGGQHKTKWQP